MRHFAGFNGVFRQLPSAVLLSIGLLTGVTNAIAAELDSEAAPFEANNLGALLDSGGGSHEAPRDQLNPAARQQLVSSIRANKLALGLITDVSAQKRLPSAAVNALPAGTTQLRWPVRPGAGNRSDFQEGISNYVDLDPAIGALQDYACGTRTYDRANGYNHEGIDIYSWPYPWTTMNTNGLDVIAAAPGTIVSKEGGQGDRSCTFNTNASWNVIVIAHEDGTQAVYGHLKRDSLTDKPVGETVAAGEYLGQVGSSGVSTGPHLHFELLDSAENPIDPFAGACGADDSRWRWQPDYNKSRINAVKTGGAAPVVGECNGSEVPSAADEFAPGDPIYVTGFFVNQKQGEAAQLQLVAPDGSVWLDVPFGTPSEDYAFSYYYRSFVAPDIAGQWRARVSLNGEFSETGFAVGADVAEGAVVAAILPGSRSVGLGQSASFFATMANAGSTELEGCRILPLDSFAGDVSFQATNPQTNAPTGSVNAPVAIPVGNSRSFVVSLTAAAEVAPLGVAFNFKCNNAPRARTVPGLNTLQYSAATITPADILPVSATATGDGVLRLGGVGNNGAFATAAVNIGAGVSNVRVVPRFADSRLSVNVCETDAAGGCVAAPAASLTTDFANQPRTFSVFVGGTGEAVEFDPENTRIDLAFEHAGKVRGVTSVAVTTD